MLTPLETLVGIVEETGTEVPVTLLVPGGILMGRLTSMKEYQAWYQAIMKAALDSTTEKVSKGTAKSLLSATSVASPRGEFFALKGAQVRMGTRDGWQMLDFILVDPSTLIGFNVGMFVESAS